MVTIGRGVLDPAVHELFEGLRTYDAARACKVLAADAVWEWEGGRMTGKPAIEQFLTGWLKDPKARPSFSIVDVHGDGAVTKMRLSVSARFGQAAKPVLLQVLCLRHTVHHVKFTPETGNQGN